MTTPLPLDAKELLIALEHTVVETVHENMTLDQPGVSKLVVELVVAMEEEYRELMRERENSSGSASDCEHSQESTD